MPLCPGLGWAASLQLGPNKDSGALWLVSALRTTPHRLRHKHTDFTFPSLHADLISKLRCLGWARVPSDNTKVADSLTIVCTVGVWSCSGQSSTCSYYCQHNIPSSLSGHYRCTDCQPDLMSRPRGTGDLFSVSSATCCQPAHL